MNKRITIGTMIILLLFIIESCKKEASIQTDEAIIVNIRYACGQACDATIFGLKIGESYFVSSKPLQDNYLQHNLPVKVSYRKTGNFPSLWKGPTNVEIIDVLSIHRWKC